MLHATLDLDGGHIESAMRAVDSTVDLANVTIGPQTLQVSEFVDSNTTFDAVAAANEILVDGGGVDFVNSSLQELEVVGAAVSFRDTEVTGRTRIETSQHIEVQGGAFRQFFQIAGGGTATVDGTPVITSLSVTDTELAVRSGLFTAGLSVFGETRARIVGSTLGGLSVADSASATLVGTEFKLNRVPVVGPSVSLNTGDLLTGTLSDGSVLLLRAGSGSSTIDLEVASTPEPATDPIVIDSLGQAPPPGLRAGEALVLSGDGDLGRNFYAVESFVDVRGGRIGADFRAVAATLEVSGGEIDGTVTVWDSDVTISGGDWSERLNLNGGVTRVSGGRFQEPVFSTGFIEVTGGVFDRELSVIDSVVTGGDFVQITVGPTVGFEGEPIERLTVTGGSIRELRVGDNTEVVVEGGAIREIDHFRGSGNNSALTIRGGAITQYTGRNHAVSVEGGSFDGFRGGDGVAISGGSYGPSFSAGTNATLRGGDFRLNGQPTTDGPVTLEYGDTLSGVLEDGSVFVFGTFFSRNGFRTADTLNEVELVTTTLPETVESIDIDSTVVAPQGLRTGQSLTLRSGGTLPRNFSAVGADVSIEGGRVGADFEAIDSEVTITGGEIGPDVILFPGVTATMTGGRILGSVLLNGDASLTVSGGDLPERLSGGEGSALELLGSQFVLAGQPVAGLSIGETLEVTAFADTLQGVLADGTDFESFVGEFGGALLLTRVAPILSGDYNADGVVDAADYTVWRDTVGQPVGTIPNDPHDGTIGQSQYETWLANFGSRLASAVPTPEPQGLVLAWLAGVGVSLRRPLR